MLDFLIAAGVDVHAQTHGGYTTLHLATSSGNRDLVNWLVALGLDGHARSNRGKTALHRTDLVIVPREGLQLVAPQDGKKVLSSLARNISPNGRIFVGGGLWHMALDARKGDG